MTGYDTTSYCSLRYLFTRINYKLRWGTRFITIENLLSTQCSKIYEMKESFSFYKKRKIELNLVSHLQVVLTERM